MPFVEYPDKPIDPPEPKLVRPSRDIDYKDDHARTSRDEAAEFLIRLMRERLPKEWLPRIKYEKLWDDEFAGTKKGEVEWSFGAWQKGGNGYVHKFITGPFTDETTQRLDAVNEVIAEVIKKDEAAKLDVALDRMIDQVEAEDAKAVQS